MTVSQPAPVIRITFPYSLAEHAEAANHTVSASRLRRFMRFFGGTALATGALVTLVGLLKGVPLGSLMRDTLPYLPLGAFWAWGGPAILSASNRRQFRREANQEGHDLETVSLSPDGIVPGANWTHPIPWSQVRRVIETETLIVIDASSDGLTYVPKHALSAADLTSIKTLLHQHFRERSKDLRLTSGDRSQRKT